MSAPNIPVSSKYGAPMGRQSYNLASLSGKVRLSRVRLNGDYDQGGAYWGAGEPLWYAHTHDCEVYLRARTRDEAKALIVAAAGDSVRFFR